jgi:hypothetical protein
MSKHLQTTKEAYLEMMKSLLEERREITAAYNEIKGKVAEIDKMLLAGDSGKVTKEEAAQEKPKVFNLSPNGFSGYNAEPIEPTKITKPLKINATIDQVSNEEIEVLREVSKIPEATIESNEDEKIKVKIPVEGITVERLEKLREMLQTAKPFKQAPKEKLNVAQATEQMKEAFMNFGKAANEFKNRANPQKANKPKKKQGGDGMGSRGGALGKKGKEAIVEILKEHGSAMQVKQLQQKLSDRFNTEVLMQSLSVILHKMKQKDKRIQSAGRGYVIFKD